MGSYETTIDTLAGELARIEATFRGLTEPEWAASTQLVPVDPDLPHWTVFELAGHFDISIGLTRMLIDGLGEEQPARDRTSFFINPRSRSEEHTSELQSRRDLVCRLLLEKKKKKPNTYSMIEKKKKIK